MPVSSMRVVRVSRPTLTWDKMTLIPDIQVHTIHALLYCKGLYGDTVCTCVLCHLLATVYTMQGKR